MRLLAKDRRGILAALETVGAGGKVDLFLFGSRTRDESRGGDIDLLILCDSVRLPEIRVLKRRLLVEIEKQIGERRADVTIDSRDVSEQMEFVRSILPGAVRLSS